MKFDLEVRACREDAGHVVEQCAPEDAEFWGVYTRPVQPDENGWLLADWIADFNTKAEADAFALTHAWSQT